jgi:hypothetical protein
VYSEQQPLTRGTETKVFFEEVTETKVKHIRRNVRVDQASLKYFLRTDSLSHTKARPVVVPKATSKLLTWILVFG